MTITAKVIADSIAKGCPRLTTFQLRYPRFIHAEVMTYRVFSRNAASSRAIPAKTFRKNVLADPAYPIYFGKNQPGMQARSEIGRLAILATKTLWFGLMYCAIFTHWLMEKLQVHKQILNRILEPWMHIEVVITATDWDNFYAQRTDKDAQPEIQHLANVMLDAHNRSTPKLLAPGEWHLPYVSPEEAKHLVTWNDDMPIQVSSARCARVSYLRHDGLKSSLEDDLRLFGQLMGGEIKHASPCEHQAQAPFLLENYKISNLRGWKQFRKTRPNEVIRSFSGLLKYES